MSSLDKPRIREMIRGLPEYKDGRLTDEQVDDIVEDMHAKQEQLREEYIKAELRRELIKMVNRGLMEYDAETDRSRRIDK